MQTVRVDMVKKQKEKKKHISNILPGQRKEKKLREDKGKSNIKNKNIKTT